MAPTSSDSTVGPTMTDLDNPEVLSVSAARHICQEARVLLTSLRSGPPQVARGELAQDLLDLRDHVHAKSAQVTENAAVQPFLQVVTDPRAAGPHTLVALRALHRLLFHRSVHKQVPYEPVTRAILACKFEQTDAGADEAVEMAIADVLALLIQRAYDEILPTTLIEAFNTVFITRNTFVHSPALCYHFEEVLTHMVTAVMQKKHTPPAHKVFEYLVNQLLHTPLVGGDGLDESTREAQMAHDATRVLSLRLVRTAIRVAWADQPVQLPDDAAVLGIVQDDLCLSLLMTGQAIWSYHDANMDISPGFVSLEVLGEICVTLSTLWNTLSLRPHLISQFETIFTGFYTRALVLLRKRKQAVNSISFNANLRFDAEVEIILESLLDILCLHDHKKSISDGDGGALETLFSFYDCSLRRSDVAADMFVELCRCCGGRVDQDGQAILTPVSSFSKSLDSEGEHSSEQLIMVEVEHPWRPVPAHLKELCAQAVVGGMKCLFRDDKPSDETLRLRSQRKSIMLRHLDTETTSTVHVLRDVKSKKRLMRKAARIFNSKPSRGIEFLLDAGLVPDPVTPASVASFLRNGIVVGLDKKAVGSYLGEAGKGPAAGKSPPCWERDWFHKDVLRIYCNLFRFEGQSLLDCLRMFLAAFRLPGEAQQIDRILEAFADCCSKVCEESSNGRLKIFSDDPKKASDAAYLLSFSIIMLNTDRHNDNIREDRKMRCEDFIKNNTDYGRDITERGKEFPRDFLIGIYESINEEEIRTEGEGAEGAMTVERWKDVLRGSTEDYESDVVPTVNDAEDLTELVLEHVWKPIMSAIGSFWGRSQDDEQHMAGPENQSGMLGVQGARLGMDMSFEMLQGVRQLGRGDIFRKIFSWVCDYTGLLGEYTTDAVERTWNFTNSMEAQSALIVAMRTALEAGEDLDVDGWQRVWAIIFELRDLKLISYDGNASQSILRESDNDLLTEIARRDWTMCLMKGDMDFDCSLIERKKPKASSVFGVVGRALFGSNDDLRSRGPREDGHIKTGEKSFHGKDELVVWDEYAPSDDEESCGESTVDALSASEEISAGATFENRIIRENLDMSRDMDMPVTGLERMDDSHRYQISPRARVRKRLRNACDLRALVSESRFLDDQAILSVLKALVALSSSAINPSKPVTVAPPPPSTGGIERTHSEDSLATATSSFNAATIHVVISPASEAFAEVLICEIALKNRDRLKFLWTETLQDHYLGALTSHLFKSSESASASNKKVDPGLEKRVTGLLRLSICAIQRHDLANEILSAWKYLLPMNSTQHSSSPLRVLDRHIAEGVCRIVMHTDGLLNLDQQGWEGLISLLKWCAIRGGMRNPIQNAVGKHAELSDDDPALQSYRSIHTLLTTDDVDKKVPCSIVASLRALVSAGDTRRYGQLSLASLDLLHLLLEKKVSAVLDNSALSDETIEVFWTSCWRQTIEGIAEAADKSSDSVSGGALSV